MAETVKRSVALTKHIDEFICRQIEAGRYASHSEVIRAGVRMLEDYETRLRQTRALVDEADASIVAGEGIEYGGDGSLTAEVVKRGTDQLAQND